MAVSGAFPVQPDLFTPGDLEVLKRLNDGESVWDISAALHISEGAVRSRMADISSRLGVASAPQAVAKALAGGIITL